MNFEVCTSIPGGQYGQSPVFACASSPMSSSSSSGSSLSEWSTIYDQQSLSPSSPPSSTTSSCYSSSAATSFNQSQPENLDQIETLARKECLKEIDMACHLLTISADPLNWTALEVGKWLRWVQRTNNLAPFKLDYFQLNGASLCTLTEADFKLRAPSCGDILYAKLDIWRWALNYGANNIRESLFGPDERQATCMSSPCQSPASQYPSPPPQSQHLASPLSYGLRDQQPQQQQQQSYGHCSPVSSYGGSPSYSSGIGSVSPAQSQSQYTICINNNFIINNNRHQNTHNYPSAICQSPQSTQSLGYSPVSKLSYQDSRQVCSALTTSDYGSEGVVSDDEELIDDVCLDFLPMITTNCSQPSNQTSASSQCSPPPSYSSSKSQLHGQFALSNPVANYPVYPISPVSTSTATNNCSSSCSSISSSSPSPIHPVPMSTQMRNPHSVTCSSRPGSVAAPATPTAARAPGSSGSHIHLWQFLKELLSQPQHYGSSIRWLDRSKGVFKIEDSVRVARLWGSRKNRPAMNYDKLSRSIRQYYKKGIMKKTERSQRLVYQFCTPYCF